LRQDGFSDLEQDNLDALSKRFGVTAIGVEASGLDHMIVVAIARPAQPFRLHVDVGSRFPALISASGRCIAAFGAYDSAEIERRFRALRCDRAPSDTAAAGADHLLEHRIREHSAYGLAPVGDHADTQSPTFVDQQRMVQIGMIFALVGDDGRRQPHHLRHQRSIEVADADVAHFAGPDRRVEPLDLFGKRCGGVRPVQ
jgi:hypothetical protein